MFDEVAYAIESGRFITGTHGKPQTKANARHVRHFGGGDYDTVFELGEAIHKREPCSGEGFGHDFGGAHAAKIVENDVDRLLRIVSYSDQLKIARADERVLFLHTSFHPSQESFPVIAAK